MDENRRYWTRMFLAACAGGVSTIAFSADGPTLTAADYKKLSNAPKTPADHRSLAKHYRAIASQHEAEAKAFEALATQYAKGVPGAADSHARELARAAKHVGGHTRDFIEALVEMAEVHEGIAEGPLK